VKGRAAVSVRRFSRLQMAVELAHVLQCRTEVGVMHRRQFLLAGLGVLLAFPQAAKAQDEVTEYQAGDPDEPPEALVLTRQQFQLMEVITS
jgi:hypothetical protein